MCEKPTEKQTLMAQFIDNQITVEDLINTIVENTKSVHVDNFMYGFEPNENNEIICEIEIHGVPHTIGITEKDARRFNRIFQ